ncbi:putrescine transporter permease PotH [Salmonella enterica subsp. enterica]|uniref:Putrescine transporter permease PotH n=1 Tax=Salmonella enterica I TaxID=59201 RepID=A0A379WWP2_SALET|nr:putrescine transporter permease PotH [Salmonella enterica subsp. enterica]
MVLPIYTALTRIDYSLVEASLDLGARPLKTFFSIIVPLTKAESSPARCWFLSRRWASL